MQVVYLIREFGCLAHRSNWNNYTQTGKLMGRDMEGEQEWAARALRPACLRGLLLKSFYSCSKPLTSVCQYFICKYSYMRWWLVFVLGSRIVFTQVSVKTHGRFLSLLDSVPWTVWGWGERSEREARILFAPLRVYFFGHSYDVLFFLS